MLLWPKSKVTEGPTSKAEKDEKDEKKTVKGVSTEKEGNKKRMNPRKMAPPMFLPVISM